MCVSGYSLASRFLRLSHYQDRAGSGWHGARGNTGKRGKVVTNISPMDESFPTERFSKSIHQSNTHTLPSLRVCQIAVLF